MTALDLAAATHLRRWSSSSSAATSIAEVEMDGAGVERLAEVLAANIGTGDGCTMLIVGMGPVERSELLSAWAIAQASIFPLRICFSVDAKTLESVGANLPASDRVGLLLDDVDDRTPLADVVNDAIEAIRFEPGFVAKATQHLRSECVLHALLTLAKNTGVATLGPVSRDAHGSWLAPQVDFDFLPDRKGVRQPVRN